MWVEVPGLLPNTFQILLPSSLPVNRNAWFWVFKRLRSWKAGYEEWRY
jgi:hypothetical protein